MIGNRAYIDNPRLFTVRPVKPPLPRGHRKWLDLAARGIEARQRRDTEEWLDPEGAKARSERTRP